MSNRRLLQARVQRHWTQEQAAENIGVWVSTYRRWEAGTRLPHASSLHLLCEVFQQSAEDLGFPAQWYMKPERGARLTQTEEADLSEETEAVPIPTDLLEIGLHALRMGQRERGWSKQQIQEYLMSQISHHHQPDAISRRESGLLLAGLPLAALAFTDIPEELFPHCEANRTTAWKLARGNDLLMAQGIVEAYLPALRPLAEKPSKFQQKAAELVAKLWMLNGLIEMHLVHLQAREQSCLQAVKYAEISGNIDLIIAARRWLAHTYYYLNNPEQAMKEYQQAASYLDRVTPLLRSNVLAHFAAVQAQLQQHHEALTSLNEAQELFFGEASADQNNLYIGHDIGVLTVLSGKVYYALGNYQKSLEALLQIDSLQPKQLTSERDRISILHQQTLAAAKLSDLDQATTCLEAAVMGSVELGSKLRFTEAKSAYQILQFLWPTEAKVTALLPLFRKNLA